MTSPADAKAPGMAAQRTLAEPCPSAERRTAQFAAGEFQRIQAEARAAVASRQLTADKAERRLKAWLAIAALAGADLPELVEALAPLRTRSVYRPAAKPIPAAERQARRHGAAGDISPGVPSAAWRTEDVNEAEARRELAEALCPSGEWRRELERATDTALARAFDAETSARAAQFLALSRALRQPYVSKPMKESIA